METTKQPQHCADSIDNPQSIDTNGLVTCAECGFYQHATKNGNGFFFCAARGFSIHEEVATDWRGCEGFEAAKGAA